VSGYRESRTLLFFNPTQTRLLCLPQPRRPHQKSRAALSPYRAAAVSPSRRVVVFLCTASLSPSRRAALPRAAQSRPLPRPATTPRRALPRTLLLPRHALLMPPCHCSTAELRPPPRAVLQPRRALPRRTLPRAACTTAAPPLHHPGRATALPPHRIFTESAKLSNEAARVL
jgi:hypothetical protein